jgi:hypothetical protein
MRRRGYKVHLAAGTRGHPVMRKKTAVDEGQTLPGDPQQARSGLCRAGYAGMEMPEAGLRHGIPF